MAKFRQWLNEEEAIKDFWNSPWMGVPLWLACGVLTLYWFYHIPPPGYAIGALAVVAGIMSVREMKTLAKVSWVFLLISLLVMEFRAIDKDRSDNEKNQIDFFNAQKGGFQGIATQADGNFKETAKGLDGSIQGLKEVLGTTQSIFKQTIPHAAMRQIGFVIQNEPVAPDIFKPGVKYVFNFMYINNGNRAATMIKRKAEIYIAKPDDLVTQQDLARKFEKGWSETKSVEKPLIIQPQIPGFWTETFELSDTEVSNLVFNGDTIYVLRRMEYSDETGKWWTDRCDHYQRDEHQIYIQVMHSCLVLMNDRYPSKRR